MHWLALKGNHQIVKTPAEKLDETPRVKHPKTSIANRAVWKVSLIHPHSLAHSTNSFTIVETRIYMKQKSSLVLDQSQQMSFLFKVYSLAPFLDLEANIGEGGLS